MGVENSFLAIQRSELPKDMQNRRDGRSH